MNAAVAGAKCPISDADLRRLVVRLREDLRAKRVWVFGSYARGEWTVGSDLDLLVEMDTELAPAERRLQARRALGSPPFPVDVLVYTPAEIEQRHNSLGSIIPTILREGILLE